jgi:hypothetical protein
MTMVGSETCMRHRLIGEKECQTIEQHKTREEGFLMKVNRVARQLTNKTNGVDMS